MKKYFLFGLILYLVFKNLAKGRAIFLKIAMQDYADLILSFQIGLIGYLAAAVFLHLAYPRNLWLLIGTGLAVAQMAINEEEKALNAFYMKRLALGEKTMLKKTL